MDRQANVEQTDSHGESLEQVEQRFRRWRESRKQGHRIPAVLWAAAAGLAKRHGAHRVARELRLDYNGLNNRVGPVGPAKRAGGRSGHGPPLSLCHQRLSASIVNW